MTSRRRAPEGGADRPPRRRVAGWLPLTLRRWLELVGQSCLYACPGMLPADDGYSRRDGRLLEPDEAYVATGISEIESFLSGQWNRPA